MGTVSRLVGGTIAGASATVVMSVAFAAAKQVGALPQLPPTIIVKGISPQFRRRRRNGVGAITHLAYGMAAGAAYVALVPAEWRGRTTGAAYGAAVWAAGYEGWLPAMGLLPRAHRDARPRAISIALAHLVYGVTLGWLTRGRQR